MSEVARISLAARIFTLAAVGAICAVRGQGYQGLGLVVVLALFAITVQPTYLPPPPWLPIAEGALAAVAAVLAYPDNSAALPYVAIPTLIAGLAFGVRAVLEVIGAEALAGTAVWMVWVGHGDGQMVGSAATWVIGGLGLGYLGTVVARTLSRSAVDSSYRSALDLIKQLQTLSGRLESGLDPVSIAEQLMDRTAELLVIHSAVLLVRTPGGEFAPLRYHPGTAPEAFSDLEDELEKDWEAGRPIVRGNRVVIPLKTDNQVVAMLLADCDEVHDLKHLRPLLEELERETVRLSAALLFAEVREGATSDERQRLAREVHDGVAQDIASLGYLIDNLVAEHGESSDVVLLRREVSRVVAELRNSVFDLRNEAGSSQGLGQSIATFARHIGSHSHLAVHVSLDESGPRLRADVEAELLRVAQEAINNARRHSGGENLWVNVFVRAPRALIDVIDDGNGLGPGRPDSHGLRIMRERAARIGADLVITSPAEHGRGTRLSVTLTSGVTKPSPTVKAGTR